MEPASCTPIVRNEAEDLSSPCQGFFFDEGLFGTTLFDSNFVRAC